MEWMQMLLAAAAALAAGVLLGVLGAAAWWRPASHTAREDAERLSAERDAARAEAEQWRQQVSDAQSQLASAQGRLAEIERSRGEEAELARERESLVEMLHPVRQGVTEVQRKVQQLETERAAQHAKLSEQLAVAAKSDAELLSSTQALLGSLHSTSARGHWGEIQLRRVVESAGMLAHVDFTEQHAHQSEHAGLLRPDLVVQLPGGRQLVVDAKAPLNSDDDGAAQAAALRQRVSELAKKRYWGAVELSPDVVFCFVPAESLLAAALQADGSLLDESLAKGVMLVSPASLLASLKAVAASWRQERLAENIAEVAGQSRELYRRLAKMSEHLGRTGDRLRQAVDSYNSLIGNIERQVLPKVESLGRLQLGSGDPQQHEHLDDLGTTVRTAALTAEVSPLGPRLVAGVDADGDAPPGGPAATD